MELAIYSGAVSLVSNKLSIHLSIYESKHPRWRTAHKMDESEDEEVLLFMFASSPV